eukprot:scaffold115645_cov63-Phaeocystis_antarctica.AAC.5
MAMPSHTASHTSELAPPAPRQRKIGPRKNRRNELFICERTCGKRVEARAVRTPKRLYFLLLAHLAPDLRACGGDCGEARDGKQRRAGRPTDARLESRVALLTPGVKIERVRLDEADCQSRDRHACEQVPRAVNHVVESPRLDALFWREARAFDALLECPNAGALVSAALCVATVRCWPSAGGASRTGRCCRVELALAGPY